MFSLALRRRPLPQRACRGARTPRRPAGARPDHVEPDAERRSPTTATPSSSALALPGSLVYEPAPFGLDSAREAVARDLSAHGPRVDPARVVLTASTSEAYAFLFKLLCDPGDEVLVPRPSYPLFEHLARLESVRAVPYRLAYDGAWHVDLPVVRAAITPRTRAIVTVSPNNPTGSYLKTTELGELAALGLPIVSDEVFARYPLRADSNARSFGPRGPPGSPLVFALGGLSKLAALPQAKLAWMAVGGEPARVDAALARLEVIADSFLSVAAPVQHALPALLRIAHRGGASDPRSHAPGTWPGSRRRSPDRPRPSSTWRGAGMPRCDCPGRATRRRGRWPSSRRTGFTSTRGTSSTSKRRRTSS